MASAKDFSANSKFLFAPLRILTVAIKPVIAPAAKPTGPANRIKADPAFNNPPARGRAAVPALVKPGPVNEEAGTFTPGVPAIIAAPFAIPFFPNPAKGFIVLMKKLDILPKPLDPISVATVKAIIALLAMFVTLANLSCSPVTSPITGVSIINAV